MTTPDKQSLIALARQHLETHRILEAAYYCTLVLRQDPRDPEALQLFGRASYMEELNAMLLCLWRLRDLGFAPRNILDIGAYKGWWTRQAKQLFPDARFLMLEAREECRPDLQEVKDLHPATVDYRIALLGQEAKENVDFFLLDSGSSVYREQSGFQPGLTRLDMATLQDLAAAAGMASAELIKLDVQGSELDILRGGLPIAQGAEVIILEVSTLEYNKGAPVFAEVVAFMDHLGFCLFDVIELRRNRRNILFQFDTVFVRKGSPLRPTENIIG